MTSRTGRRSRPFDRLTRRSFLAAAGSFAAAPVLAQSGPGFGPEAFVAPAGDGDGRTVDSPAPLTALGELAATVGAGGTVYLLANRGRYQDWETVEIGAGGAEGAPVTIRGVNTRLQPRNAVFQGDRRRWRRPRNESRASDASEFGGSILFRFRDGSSHLRFQNISAVDVGRFFDFGGAEETGITLEDVDFTNVRDGFFTDEDSVLSNVVLRRFSGVGFSKKGIRVHGGCQNWEIEDCELDSGWQFGDNFAVGIELNHTAHNIVIRGGYTINCLDKQDGDEEAYWNGDGIASEWGNYGLRIANHRSTGHSDGGYDLKSDDAVLIGCTAEDNKRNFRIWGGGGTEPVRLEDCRSISPRSRGGTGAACHLWLPGVSEDWGGAGSALFLGGELVDKTLDAVPVYVDGDNAAVHFVGADLSRLSPHEQMLDGVGEGSRVIVGSPGDPSLSEISTPEANQAIEGLSKTLLLVADGEASWRIVGEQQRVRVVGDRLVVAASDTRDPLNIEVQARGANGQAIRKALMIETVDNPVAPGTALAVAFAGPDGSTTAVDATGLNTIEFMGEARIEGEALRVAGPENFAAVADSDNFSFPGDFTIDIEFAVDEPESEDGQDILTHWGDSSNQRGYMVRVEADGKPACAWSHDGRDEGIRAIAGETPLEPGRFYKIRVDRVGGTVRLYVDGHVVAQAADAGTPIMNPNVPIRISGRADGKYGAVAQVRSLLINHGYALAGSDDGYDV